MARALTTGDEYGFIINLGQDAHMLDSWSTVFLGFGGQFLNEDGSAGFNSEAGVASLQYIIDLYNEGVIPPDAIEMDDGGVQAALQQGRGAMAIIFSGWYAPIINPEASDIGDQIEVAALPSAANTGLAQGPSLLSVWAWGVSNYSENQDAAWQVISQIVSPEVQRTMAIEFGNGPTVAEIYNDPDFIAANPGAPGILQALSGGLSQPPIEEWATISTILTEEVTRAIVGDVTPQEALDAATARANEVLGK
jgi:multiple sugar transport system substrate-binding protein